MAKVKDIIEHLEKLSPDSEPYFELYDDSRNEIRNLKIKMFDYYTIVLEPKEGSE